MAACSQQAVLDFVRERGGRVKHTDLTEHFRRVFPEQPAERAAARLRFKSYVNNAAFVITESGVKYVCLRNRFRGSAGERRGPGGGGGTETGPEQVSDEGSRGAHGGQAAAGPRALPGSGYGSDSQVRAPRHPLPAADDRRGDRECVRAAERAEMGNTGSCKPEKKNSKRERAGKAPEIPQISVIEASPLPAEGSVFSLPAQTGGTGPGPARTPARAEADAQRSRVGRLVSAQQDDEDDEGQFDTGSLSGSDGHSTPKGSRGHFIQVMISSSPQVRRSMALRRSAHLSSPSDSDSASLASSNLDEDRSSVALDPLEHEWMMCASDGEWDSLRHLLTAEPGLVLRRDFVTGFTCLHWAAKLGKPELIALVVNFAKQHNVPVSVDVRSGTGYTPLHIAAMHNHMEVVKLLVGAYSADVDLRDHSGRKACQYLTDGASVDIRDIIGAYEQSHSLNTGRGDGGRWRFSRVLQSNLNPIWLLSSGDRDSADGEGRPREKPLRRKSSLSGMKPRLPRRRARTSQIVHSTSFHNTEEQEASEKGSLKSRPKTHFLG